MSLLGGEEKRRKILKSGEILRRKQKERKRGLQGPDKNAFTGKIDHQTTLRNQYTGKFTP
jgi:hypothetical protein